MLRTHRQVALIADAAIAPQPTAIHLRQSDSDVGHTSHFSAFASVSPIRHQFRRSRGGCPRRRCPGRRKGKSALPAHGVQARLFGRVSYIVRVREAGPEHSMPKQPHRDKHRGVKLMGAPVRPTVRRPRRRWRGLCPLSRLGAVARRLPDSRDGVGEPGWKTQVVALKRTQRVRSTAGALRG
jgi:hypothetical protein